MFASSVAEADLADADWAVVLTSSPDGFRSSDWVQAFECGDWVVYRRRRMTAGHPCGTDAKPSPLRSQQVTGACDLDELDASLQHRVLEALTDAKRYTMWVAEIVRPYLGDHPIEIGSGLGEHAGVASWLAERRCRATHPRSRKATEIWSQTMCRLRFANDLRVEGAHAAYNSITLRTHHFSVVAINVLERIEDDAGHFAELARFWAPSQREDRDLSSRRLSSQLSDFESR